MAKYAEFDLALNAAGEPRRRRSTGQRPQKILYAVIDAELFDWLHEVKGGMSMSLAITGLLKAHRRRMHRHADKVVTS